MRETHRGTRLRWVLENIQQSHQRAGGAVGGRAGGEGGRTERASLGERAGAGEV